MTAGMLPEGIPRPTPGVVEEATAGLVRVVERTREVAPAARLLLVDYLTVLDAESLSATPFTADELRRFLEIQTAIGAVFRGAAERTGADLVLASTLSRGHALGSDEPWVTALELDPASAGGSFHPNEAGMTAVADELARVLG